MPAPASVPEKLGCACVYRPGSSLKPIQLRPHGDFLNRPDQLIALLPAPLPSLQDEDGAEDSKLLIMTKPPSGGPSRAASLELTMLLLLLSFRDLQPF